MPSSNFFSKRPNVNLKIDKIQNNVKLRRNHGFSKKKWNKSVLHPFERELVTSMSFLLRPVSESNGKVDHGVVNIQPEPCFVVKSKINDQKRSGLIKNSKVFVNICHNTEVPLPEIDFDPNVVYPLIMNNQWEIPIITSMVREDADKKGNLCYVWDCCVNSKCISWIQKDLQLREILVEWCLESCEIVEGIEISRELLAFPKLKKKGDQIPALEVLHSQLKEDFRTTIREMAQRNDRDPVSILEMKRDLISEEDLMTDQLPPLIPNLTSPQGRPLIEEINDLSILDKARVNHKNTLKELDFEVILAKTKDTNDFKLRVEISSELQSANDYVVTYNSKSNTLLVRSNNSDYKEKTVEIPLPNIFTEGQTSFECFFVKPQRRLMIFL